MTSSSNPAGALAAGSAQSEAGRRGAATVFAAVCLWLIFAVAVGAVRGGGPATVAAHATTAVSTGR